MIIKWIIIVAICAELSVIIRNMIAIPSYKRIVQKLFRDHNLFLINDNPDFVKKTMLTSLTVDYDLIDNLSRFKNDKVAGDTGYNTLLQLMWDKHVFSLTKNDFIFKTKIPLSYYFKWNLTMMDLIVSEPAIRRQVELELSNYYLK